MISRPGPGNGTWPGRTIADSGCVDHVTARGPPAGLPGPGAARHHRRPASAAPAGHAAGPRRPGIPANAGENREGIPACLVSSRRPTGRMRPLDCSGRPRVRCKRYNLEVPWQRAWRPRTRPQSIGAVQFEITGAESEIGPGSRPGDARTWCKDDFPGRAPGWVSRDRVELIRGPVIFVPDGYSLRQCSRRIERQVLNTVRCTIVRPASFDAKCLLIRQNLWSATAFPPDRARVLGVVLAH